MPILAKPDEYVVPLTFKCDWNCSYCAVRNSHDYREKVSLESILRSVSQIRSGSTTTLTGGEPGLAPREWIETVLQQLEAKNVEIWLETNGLFAKRYPDLLSHFHEILYHCSQDLDPADEVLDVQHSRVRYLLVVHDGNFSRLGAFMDARPQIRKWDVVEATYPYETTGPTLSRKLKHKLLCEFSQRLTAESAKRLVREKDFDSIQFLNFGNHERT